MLSHAEPYQLPGRCLIGPKKAAIVAFLIALCAIYWGPAPFWLFQEASSGRTLQECSLPAQKKKRGFLLGEMIGTGLVAALIASFMSTYLMGKTVPFTFLSFPLA